MNLIWSLGNVVGNNEPHSDFVYDMFYLSIALAKDLKYQTTFYGTHESVHKMKPYVNQLYDSSWLDYRLYDDLKVNIWYDTNDTSITIDGDIFLYNRLDIDHFNNGTELIYEKKQMIHPKTEYALEIFNSFNPKQIIPEWDFNNKFSICTGIIGWKKNSEFKKYYCESYAKLRKWFFKNEEYMKKNSSYLSKDSSVSAHIICEHLLYQLSNYYKISKKEIISNQNNKYWHLQGPDKFKDIDFINNIKILVDEHKNSNLTITQLYNKMLTNGTFKKAFLFKQSKIII
jgi:hypothetical protein